MARKRIWVSPDGDRWKVKTEGGERASGIFDNKDEAINRARDLAKKRNQAKLLFKSRTVKYKKSALMGMTPIHPRDS